MTVNGEICSVFFKNVRFQFYDEKNGFNLIMTGILVFFDQIFQLYSQGNRVLRDFVKCDDSCESLSLSSALMLSFLFVFNVFRYFVTLQSNTDKV